MTIITSRCLLALGVLAAHNGGVQGFMVPPGVVRAAQLTTCPASPTESPSVETPSRSLFSRVKEALSFLNPLAYRDHGVGEELRSGIAGFYDESTAIWEEVWGDHLHHGYYYTGRERDHKKAQVDMIEEALKFGGVTEARTAVDVGCGIGGSSRHIARKFGADVVGITLSPFQRGRAEALTTQAGLQDKAQFQVADALQMPFPDSSFDLVWSMESGEHMPDKTRFINELKRVAAPGGKIIVVTWCHRDLQPGEALTRVERALLKLINKIYFLPPWVSISDYVKVAEAAGLKACHQSGSMPSRKAVEAPPPATNAAISRPCLSCRKSKVRCDRAFPCSRCLRLNIECVEQQRTRRGKSSSGGLPKKGTNAAASKLGAGGKGKTRNRDSSSASESCGSSSSSSCPISSDEAYEDMSPEHFYNLDDDEDGEEVFKAMEEEGPFDEGFQSSNNLPSTLQWFLASFLRQYQGGRVSRQKTLAIMRGWAMGCSNCDSDSSDDCVSTLANALGVDRSTILSDSNVIGEANGFTRSVHQQAQSFESKDLDPFLQDIYSMACASVAFICCLGERRLISNQGYSAEFALPEDRDSQKVTPLDICGCVSADDYEEFAESVTALLFCCAQTHGETAHVIKCQNRHGEVYMALARVRFLIADGGGYMAAVLSLQRLPPSRYVFPESSLICPSQMNASCTTNMAATNNMKSEDATVAATAPAPASSSLTHDGGDSSMLMFPTPTLDCTTSSASSSTSSLSLLVSSTNQRGPPPRWPPPGNGDEGGMMTKGDSSNNLPFSTWLQEGEDTWSWCSPALETQKGLVSGDQQIGMDFTADTEGDVDALRIEDVPSSTGASDGNLMNLLEEDIF